MTAGADLPPISVPPTSWTLRNRALAMMNGEARSLTSADRERRRRVLEALAKGRRR